MFSSRLETARDGGEHVRGGVAGAAGHPGFADDVVRRHRAAGRPAGARPAGPHPAARARAGSPPRVPRASAGCGPSGAPAPGRSGRSAPGKSCWATSSSESRIRGWPGPASSRASGANSACPALWKPLSVTGATGEPWYAPIAILRVRHRAHDGGPGVREHLPGLGEDQVAGPPCASAGPPRSSAAAASCWETAEGVTSRVSATALTLPSAPSSRSISSWWISMPLILCISKS